jgi:hypothetical protein
MGRSLTLSRFAPNLKPPFQAVNFLRIPNAETKVVV